jgi:hypothetical protein
MSSRASSEPFKPAKLPVVGTTWVRRGAGYWLRRIFISGYVIVILSGLFAIILYGFFHLVSSLPTGWRLVCEVAYCALCVVGGVWGWVRARRKVRSARETPPTPEEAQRINRAGQRAAPGLASAGRLPALLLMPFLAPLFAWLLGTLLAVSLVRVLSTEIEARRRWEAQRSGSTRPSARSR